MWTTTFHLNKKLPGPDIMSPVLITITLAFETSPAAFSQAIAFPEASEASHHALNAFPHAGLLDSTAYSCHNQSLASTCLVHRYAPCW